MRSTSVTPINSKWHECISFEKFIFNRSFRKRTIFDVWLYQSYQSMNHQKNERVVEATEAENRFCGPSKQSPLGSLYLMNNLIGYARGVMEGFG